MVPARVEHATAFHLNLRAGSVCIDPDTVAELADAIGCSANALAIGQPETAETIAALGRVLRSELSLPRQGQSLFIESLTEAMAIAMLRGGATRDSAMRARDRRVCAAIERIETSYAEDLTLAELAKIAGLSRFHFSRLFREQVGTSPYRFLIEVRLRRAAELLRTGRVGATDAAFAVGFADLGRFARMFHLHFGVLPSQISSKIRTRRRTIR